MRDPDALISPTQLEKLLGDPGLRIYDCTTYLEPAPPNSPDPYIALPGRATFEAAHIPGADFLDLQGEFSDPTTRLRFMMPATAQLAAAFGRHGLGNNNRAVLYSVGTPMWATRLWWLGWSLTSHDSPYGSGVGSGLPSTSPRRRPPQTIGRRKGAKRSGAATGRPPS